MSSSGEQPSRVPPAIEDLPATIAPGLSDTDLTDAGSLGQLDQATADFTSGSTLPGEVGHDARTADFSFSPPNLDAVTSAFDATAYEARRPKMIGDYQIDRVLGRGGMGIVYKARQSKLGRDVALKMVLAGSHASNELLARFISEAKAVAHLQHPNIVQIFEVGEHENLPFFSLEYVDGDSLDKRIAGKPLPPDEAAQLTITLCQAMQYAHDHGVLHRDLKPANVLVSSQGIPKVTDFGLAKRLEDEDDSSSTRTGTIMGTPSYMSPEQARGAVRDMGPTTDQYSIGAILYEFLTGRPPFTSPKPVETIMMVLNNEPVPPRQLMPKLPVDLETICLKALQKDAAKRYASCQAMADDLGRFLRNEPIQARPVSKAEQFWRWCRRNPLVASLSLAAGLALVAVAGISSWSAVTLSKKNEEIKQQAEIARNNESRALEQEKIAKDNEQRAVEQEGLAKSRASSLVETVKNIFLSVNSIDVDENPRMEESRNGIIGGLLPLLEREVLQDMPTDDRALLLQYGLQKSMADNYFATNRKEEAAKLYTELEKAFGERAERKKTDAARANYATAVRAMGDLKRELYRDLDASLEYFQKQLAIANEVWQNSRADDQGLGKHSDYQRTQLLTRAHYDLAVTLYRIGKLSEAKVHYDIALNGYKKQIALHPTDPWVAKLSPVDQRNLLSSVQRAYSTAELAYSWILYRSGQAEAAEPIMRRAAEESKAIYERDITNASALRDVTGKLGSLAEFLAQTGRTDEAIPLLEEAAQLGTRMLSMAPNNSELQRTFALAQYRLCQWRSALKLPEAESPGQLALEVRRKRVKLDAKNDRYRIELMCSEAQIGDVEQAQQLIDSFFKQDRVDNELLVEIARACSLLSTRVEPSQAESKLAQANKAIETAIKQGYEDLVSLEKEIDLAALRKYPPFVELRKR